MDKLLFASDDDDRPVDDETQTLLCDQAAAVRAPLLSVAAGNDLPSKPRCSFFEGYSLHADLAVHQSSANALYAVSRTALDRPFGSWARVGDLPPEIQAPAFVSVQGVERVMVSYGAENARATRVRCGRTCATLWPQKWTT